MSWVVKLFPNEKFLGFDHFYTELRLLKYIKINADLSYRVYDQSLNMPIMKYICILTV